jgi:hypothetical protein
LAASLDHPHVVPVYAAGEHEGVLYIAMRLVDGVDLRALIRAEGRLQPERASRIAAQVAAALGAAHERGLVYRDVKPANVLVAGGEGAEHAYLTDFGLVKRSASESGLTAAGEWVGTLDYVAPEQLRGDSVDGRADLYSLGCLLFEALTGRVPFPRENELGTLWAHISDPPPDASEVAPGVPPELAAVARRAMAKLPDQRYGTADELRLALEAGSHGDWTGAPTRLGGTPAVELGPEGALPAPVTRTIGREQDTRAITELLRQDDVRLVTLIGPGGVGKTRLAIEALRIVAREFVDGAWFVSLAGTAAAERVPSAIVQALPFMPLPGEVPETAVRRYLAAKRALLVLDNLEHLPAVAALVSELLGHCGALQVLATSRAPLQISAEYRYTVAPLALPPDDEPTAIERAAAGALFVERVRSHDPGFQVTENKRRPSPRSVADSTGCHSRSNSPPLAPPYSTPANSTTVLATRWTRSAAARATSRTASAPCAPR